MHDLTEESKVELLRSLFLPHKYVDAVNNAVNFNFDGIRRRMSRSATRTSIHKLPDVRVVVVVVVVIVVVDVAAPTGYPFSSFQM